jgi:two-component system, OmpR family, sensor kinase
MSLLPIRVRLTAAFAVAMAAVLAGSGLFLYLRLSSHLGLTLDRELQLRAQDLAALVAQPQSTLANDSSSRVVERGESYAQLVTPEGRVVDATQPLGRTPVLDQAEVRAASRRPIFVDKHSVPGLNEPSRVLAVAVVRDGRPRVLIVGATSQNNAETLAAFRTELLIAGPIALILASILGYLLAGLSLRQVEAMRRRAASITAETPGERLPVPATGDELQRLGETLNELLERLEGAIAREREFVADAGHELRTPLALLRTELELALRQATTPAELRDAIRWSSHEAERLSQLAEDLLVIARADRGQLALQREQLDVRTLFDTVASRFDWRAAELAKVVRVTDCPAATVSGDRLRLEQALANLVDNALRHGGEAIELCARVNGEAAELHVRDDGAGFSPEFAARAFERFTRADTARSGDGAGLGLSIVRTIAESHGGSAQIAGADVWISLPHRSEALVSRT